MDLIGELARRARHGDDPDHPRSRRWPPSTATASSSCMPATSSRRRPTAALFAHPRHPYTAQADRRDAGRDRVARRAWPRSRAACPTCAAPTCRPAATAIAASASRPCAQPLPQRDRRRAPRRRLLESAMSAHRPAARRRRAGEAFPSAQAGLLARARRSASRGAAAAAACRRRGELHHRPRRDGRPGGRIGLRQVDPGAADHPPARSDLGQHPVRRRRARRLHGPRLRRPMPHRARIQMVFQDAADRLNPRFTAFDAIADPLRRLTEMSGAAAHGPRRGAGRHDRPAARAAARAFRTSSRAARRRASASPAPSRSSPSC